MLALLKRTLRGKKIEPMDEPGFTPVAPRYEGVGSNKSTKKNQVAPAPRSVSFKKLNKASPVKLKESSPEQPKAASPEKPKAASPVKLKESSPEQPKAASPEKPIEVEKFIILIIDDISINIVLMTKSLQDIEAAFKIAFKKAYPELVNKFKLQIIPDPNLKPNNRKISSCTDAVKMYNDVGKNIDLIITDYDLSKKDNEINDTINCNEFCNKYSGKCKPTTEDENIAKENDLFHSNDSNNGIQFARTIKDTHQKTIWLLSEFITIIHWNMKMNY